MSRQVQVPGTGMIALGVFIVAFVLLMVTGYSFFAALLLAVVVAVAVAIFFLVAQDRATARPAARVTAGRSADRDAGFAAAPLMPAAPKPEPAAEKAARVETPAAASTSPGTEPGDAPPKVAPAPATHEAAPALARTTTTQEAPAATGTGEQLEPLRLDAPRDGAADDLKRIKGVGPKIEDQLNRMGIFHLDQIAAWGSAEVAWMDEHLEDFRGRVSREDWAGQARQLSEGGETEFSRRVDEGDVYD